MKSLTALFISCCMALLLVSCSSKQVTVQERQLVEGIDMIAVLPVRTLAEEGKNISGTEAGELRAGADLANSVLQQELGGNEKIKIISIAELDRLRSSVSGGFGGTIAGLGSDLGADAVLLVTMRRYKQREGGDYAVDAPASASFKMNLYDTKTRSVIWVADFNETQESLMANILSFGKAQSRGFKWITVEDLVTQGIRERLAELPYL